eukprot:814872-Amphidinium_carterae.1
MKRHVVSALFDEAIPAWRKSLPPPPSASGSSAEAGTALPPLAGIKLLDFGSGDGRILGAAAGR